MNSVTKKFPSCVSDLLASTRSCPSPPGTNTSARARVVRGPIAPRVVVSMVATRSSTARARRDSAPDAPLVHWHVCVALIVVVTVASKFGDALAPTLVDTRPLTLLALNANDLHLALTAGRTKVRAAPPESPVRACSSTALARRDSTTTRRADLTIRPPRITVTPTRRRSPTSSSASPVASWRTPSSTSSVDSTPTAPRPTSRDTSPTSRARRIDVACGSDDSPRSPYSSNPARQCVSWRAPRACPRRGSPS